MNKQLNTVIVAIVIMIVSFFTGVVIEEIVYNIKDKINQERCYNLPLNDFYKDESCLKYVEKLNE